MKSVIRKNVRQPGTQTSREVCGQEVSQKRCARFMRRYPSFDPTSSPTPCMSDNPWLFKAYAKSQVAVTSPTRMDSWQQSTAGRLPEVSEQLGHGNNGAGERSDSNRAEQFPEHDIESLTPTNESDSKIIDKDGLGNLETPVTFRLLPQLDPIKPAYDTASPRLKASSQLDLWESEALFGGGALLQCPHYQETILRASQWYGSRSTLYFCCQCFMGPQVWQVNPFCSYCHAMACPRCQGWSTD